VSAPALGINCPPDCTRTFTSGASITLNAMATGSSVFAGWTGACAGQGTTCSFTITADQAVTASFTSWYNLGVAKSGSGTGVVNSGPAGITCGADCGELYPPGTVVTLTATPDPGSTFAGWSGACTGVASPCTVTMSAGQAVTATFNRSATLSVARAGAGSGTGAASPAARSGGGRAP